MTQDAVYSFRAVTRDDLARLNEWMRVPHVARWWDEEAEYDETDLADTRVSRWIVSIDDRPIAYMQDYTVHGWPDHHFRELPEGSRGIDQFIGEPDMIGHGHGPAFIQRRMQALFEDGAPVVATDPHPDNKQAIAAYRKAGFEPLGPPLETPWGLILPMSASAP